MGPLERLIGSFYLFRYIGEEEKGKEEIFSCFGRVFLFRFSSQNLPRASQDSPKSLPRASRGWRISSYRGLRNSR